MKAKSYNILFLITYSVLAVAAIITAAILQPYEGDLTRIGGKTENQFGWTKPIKLFTDSETQFYIKTKQHYDGEEDVLIFGDSFSHLSSLDNTRRYGWQTFLLNQTGLSSFVYHLEHQPIEQWLDSNSPTDYPDLIVFQQVERKLKIRAFNQGPCQVSPFAETNNDNLEIKNINPAPFPAAMVSTNRPTAKPLEFNTALHWLRSKVQGKKKVFELNLNQAGLFSSQASEKLLVHNEELEFKHPLKDTKIQQIACFLKHIKRKAEANGRTQLIIALAPDKFSVYKPFVEEDYPTTNLIEALHQLGIPIARYDLLFQQAVSQGAVDLYLPNDTHWGPEGSRLFAAAIAAQIKPKP